MRTERDEQRAECGKPGARQEKEGGKEERYEDRGGGNPRRERAAQATSARLAPGRAAATCSLVRPKRRSRLR